MQDFHSTVHVENIYDLLWRNGEQVAREMFLSFPVQYCMTNIGTTLFAFNQAERSSSITKPHRVLNDVRS